MSCKGILTGVLLDVAIPKCNSYISFAAGACMFICDKQNAREIPKAMLSWLQCMLGGIPSLVFLVMHVTWYNTFQVLEYMP